MSNSPIPKIAPDSEEEEEEEPDQEMTHLDSHRERRRHRGGASMSGSDTGGKETAGSPTSGVQNLQESLVMPCLGRPFQPGMLYDARNHAIGPQLWTEKQLEAAIVTQECPQQKHELVAEDSTADKMSSVNVGASLSMSLLGGMIDISGSARFAIDNKTSKHHSRVALRYTSTTESEDIPLAMLQELMKSFPSIFESRGDGAPTHVAFRVVYGSQVFMVFDMMSNKEENQMEIQGKLQATLKLGVPLMEGGGAEIDADINTDDKSFVNRISIKFYGDGVQLAYNPTSYQEALDVYKNLPNMTGEKGAPQMVWLYPLSNLVPSETPIKIPELSPEFTGKVHQLVDNIQDLQVRCSDILSKTNSNLRYLHIHKQQSIFQKWIAGKRNEMTTELSKTLPAIHGDKEKVSQLHDFLKKFEESFPYESLSSWMSEKEVELSLFLSYANVLLKAGVKPAFQDDESGLASLYTRVDCLLFLRFYIFQKDGDPYLEWLLNMKKGKAPHFQPTRDGLRSLEWYKDTKALIEMKVTVNEFATIASGFKDLSSMSQVAFAMTCVPRSHHGSKGRIARYHFYGRDSDIEFRESQPERIKSSSGDWYLSVKDGNTTPGTPVVVDVKNDKQQWKRLHIMMGAFYIISTLDNQLKLTVLDDGVVVTSYSGTLFEEDWPGKDAEKDTFLLKVFHSKKVLVLDPKLESAEPTPRIQVLAYIQDQKKGDDGDQKKGDDGDEEKGDDGDDKKDDDGDDKKDDDGDNKKDDDGDDKKKGDDKRDIPIANKTWSYETLDNK